MMTNSQASLAGRESRSRIAIPDAHIQRVATSTPRYEVHEAFQAFASGMLQDERARSLFQRMAEKAQIDRRYSCLSVTPESLAAGETNAYDLYRLGAFPSTGARMEIFEHEARPLLRCALDRLALTPTERASVRHVIVTCCTGFYAPGLDFDVADHLGLPSSTERSMIGFMGCYAAINGLKLARHIVRSEPGSRVVLVNLELCTLHLQETQDLNKVLSFLIFGDGCAASLIGPEPQGFAMDEFACVTIPETRDLITWRVGDSGYDMHLSGQVPASIAGGLAQMREHLPSAAETDLWAVHPGGRSVLDGVEAGLQLRPEALAASRAVLRQYGNMSSATVMFVLASMLKQALPGQRGCAMSFGPGLTAETMRFHAV